VSSTSLPFALTRAGSVDICGRQLDGILNPVTATIDGPTSSPIGLAELEDLWTELHLTHLAVATYEPLVQDVAVSWIRRKEWYEKLLADGGVYLVARRGDGRAIGYIFAQVTDSEDDTFDTHGGTVEIVSLIVTSGERGRGVGRQLMAAVERHAWSLDLDTLKVAVMAGNDAASLFYVESEFRPAEQVLYRTLR
jgi:GNAT superfamily N-acetyltransferase